MIIQLLVSLAAILALVWLAGRLGLGGSKGIDNEGEAHLLAQEVVPGFIPVETIIDRNGHGALLRDARGRIVMIRRHGSHFAGRLIECQPASTLHHTRLTIRADDVPFGAVTLDLGRDADSWAAILNRMPQAVDA